MWPQVTKFLTVLLVKVIEHWLTQSSLLLVPFCYLLHEDQAEIKLGKSIQSKLKIHFRHIFCLDVESPTQVKTFLDHYLRKHILNKHYIH